MTSVSSAPDIVLFNGRIAEPNQRQSPASALAVAGGRILAIGADQDMQNRAGADTEKIDLEGRLVVPGFVDTHIHFYEWALKRRDMALDDISCLEELLARVRQAAAERDFMLDLFEETFNHRAFTGRSGTFFAFEGLGSIYWHMVSKLLLAVQEVYLQGVEQEEDEDLLNQLKDHYYEIKAGIGLYKSPDVYGAFPTDAYSHTPGGAGVKQPGLTGQVKEDVISRIFELGIRIVEGMIQFDPSLLNSNELLKKKKEFEIIEMDGRKRTFSLDQGDIAFTFCQIPR